MTNFAIRSPISCLCAAWVSASLLFGCTSSQRVFPLAVSAPSAKPPGGSISDYARAVAAIVAIVTDEIGLPAPDGTVTLYSNRVQLEAALVSEFHRDAELIDQQLDAQAREKSRSGRDERLAFEARRLATTSPAIAMHKRIFINELIMTRFGWYERIRLLAHEVAHVVERGLFDGRPAAPGRWIQEGFAEWVAFKVQDKLGYESFAKSRQNNVNAVAAAKVFQTFPGLSQLNSGDEWLTWVRTLGNAATYTQSFLAVDFLIEQKGLAVLVDYFRRFAKLNNREKNFAMTAGESMKTFEAKFDNHLTSLLGRNAP